MSDKSTTYPHQDLLSESKVTIAELPQKTQDLITKFGTLTDDDAKDAMDEKIYGLIEDYKEDKAEKEKAAKTKAKVEAHKAKKIDLSKAATATGADDEDPDKDKKKDKKGDDNKPKSKGLLGTIFGR